MKSLETALRFGAPLIVMDVDKVDPILNNVLNRETHKSCSIATTKSVCGNPELSHRHLEHANPVRIWNVREACRYVLIGSSRGGPRVLITLGDQDIDFSPAFETLGSGWLRTSNSPVCSI